ncbi:hypothetical protein Rcae01_01953 [Novipirellula caenicola]|uniref:Uncharacterized protein n=1 Tax=Novipirellula caenicola TaxID=1536901 RepID=A0ABP9VPH2_9BACT
MTNDHVEPSSGRRIKRRVRQSEKRERPEFTGEIDRPATSDNAPYVVLKVRKTPYFRHFVWDRLLACHQHPLLNSAWLDLIETLDEFRYERLAVAEVVKTFVVHAGHASRQSSACLYPIETLDEFRYE